MVVSTRLVGVVPICHPSFGKEVSGRAPAYVQVCCVRDLDWDRWNLLYFTRLQRLEACHLALWRTPGTTCAHPSTCQGILGTAHSTGVHLFPLSVVLRLHLACRALRLKL